MRGRLVSDFRLALATAILAGAGCGVSPTNGDAAVAGGGGAAPGTPWELVAPCGTGTWQPGALEIHHIDIGQGDSTFIVGPTGRTLLIDVGEPRWDGARGAEIIGPYVKRVFGCARIDTVLITHFHVDHIGYVDRGGLWHLARVQGFTFGRMLHRDFRSYLGDSSGTFTRWRDFLADAGRALLNPAVVEPGTSQVDLGPGVTFTIVGSDGAGMLARGDFSRDKVPPNENDYSVASLLRYGRFDYFIGGDLTGELAAVAQFGYAYHDIETAVARKLPDLDVLRVSHHGSDHSSNATFVAQVDPEVSIISDGNGNTFGHPRQSVVDRLLATGAVYLTERGDVRTNPGKATIAGHVVVRSVGGFDYSVNGDVYQAVDPERIDADHDGYFREADPDDRNAAITPDLHGGCDPAYQMCGK